MNAAGRRPYNRIIRVIDTSDTARWGHILEPYIVVNVIGTLDLVADRAALCQCKNGRDPDNAPVR